MTSAMFSVDAGKTADSESGESESADAESLKTVTATATLAVLDDPHWQAHQRVRL